MRDPYLTKLLEMAINARAAGDKAESARIVGLIDAALLKKRRRLPVRLLARPSAEVIDFAAWRASHRVDLMNHPSGDRHQ